MSKQVLSFEELSAIRAEKKEKYDRLVLSKKNEKGVKKRLLKFQSNINYSLLSDQELQDLIEKEFPDFVADEQKVILDGYRAYDEGDLRDVLQSFGKQITNFIESIKDKITYFIGQKKTKK